MIFGKHINRYYLRYAPMLLLGLVTLVAVDYLQLIIPELYQLVIDGMHAGSVTVDGVDRVFDLEFLMDVVCMPMVWVILGVCLGIENLLCSCRPSAADDRSRRFDRYGRSMDLCQSRSAAFDCSSR